MTHPVEARCGKIGRLQDPLLELKEGCRGDVATDDDRNVWRDSRRASEIVGKTLPTFWRIDGAAGITGFVELCSPLPGRWKAVWGRGAV